MVWKIEIQGQWKAKYVYYRTKRKKGKEWKSVRIYFGKIEVASEILGDLLTKPLIDERLVTSSGEAIISKIADDINLTNLIGRYTNEKKANILGNIMVVYKNRVKFIIY